MRYPGGKGKCFQHIINLMPPHDVYIETHLGSGAVMRHKSAAKKNIGIDIDPVVIGTWKREGPIRDSAYEFLNMDAITALDSLCLSDGCLIYADPPYLPHTRRAKRVYKYEYDLDGHIKLLEKLRSLPCQVMVSGYASEEYDALLSGWNKVSFFAQSHVGPREEFIWYNFPTPSKLADPRFIGGGYRERQDIKRRLERLKQRISNLSLQEQILVKDWLELSLDSRN